MEQRINAFEKGQGALKAMLGVSAYLAKSPIEKNLLHLIEYRVSQINGCAYCFDMHSKDLRHEGETEQQVNRDQSEVSDRDVELDEEVNREKAALTHEVNTLKAKLFDMQESASKNAGGAKPLNPPPTQGRV